MNDTARAERILPWIALVPPLVIALLVFSLGVDVPYWDTWDWLDRHYPAEADAASMLRRYWAPFNGHRVFLPLLLDRVLLDSSGIDMWPRIAAKLLLSLATLAALLAMVRSTLARVPAWLTAAVATLAFPLAYWPMWMDPRQFSLHIVVLCMVTALRVADSARPMWTRLVLSALLCAAASLSYGPGMLTWPFVALVLWTRDQRPPALTLAAWTLAASVLLVLHAHDASLGNSVAATVAPAFGPALFGALVVAGLPVTVPIPLVPNVSALLMGATGVVVLAACAAQAWRGTPGDRRRAMPWLALGSWAAAYAATVGAARGGLPLGALRDPRFAYLAAHLWIAIVVLLAQVRGPSGRGSSSTRHTAAAVATAIVFAGILMGSVRPFVARRGIASLSRQLATGRDCLRSYALADKACLALLHPSPDRVRAIAARLDARGAAFLRARDERDRSEDKHREALPQRDGRQ